MPTVRRVLTQVLCEEVLRQVFAPPDQGGIGHNLPQEAPQAFAKAVIDVDRN